MKRWLRLLGGLVAIAACGFFIWQLAGSARAIGQLIGGMAAGPLVLACLASSTLFVLIYPLTGLVFPGLVSGPVPIGRVASVGILSTGQLARYLPGNVGQHIARGAMLKARGIAMTAIVPALMLEALLSVMAACIIAGTALVLLPSHGIAYISWPTLLCLVVAGVAGLLALRALPALGPRFSARFGTRLAAFTHALAIRPTIAAQCLVAYSLNYVVVGAGMYAIAHVVAPGVGSLGLYIGAFAISWIVGFLAPGLPAGLGVREGVLVALLTPYIGATGAVTLAALHRLSTTVGDAFAALLGAALLWRERRVARPRPASPTTPD